MSSISRPALLATFWMVAGTLHAEELLFVGNSFTFGDGDKAVQKNGGVPKLIEAIAAAKGKTAHTMMVAVGGKDWGFHLQQPKTGEALSAKSWDWVILQDYSTKPTHMGNLGEFLLNGETFYKRIREKAPRARIGLYETWARSSGSNIYTGTSTPGTFVDPAEMTTELKKAYKECQSRLEALESGDQKVTIVCTGGRKNKLEVH